MNLSKRLVAEFFGTFWLVFAGCGSAILGGGAGYLGVSLAFGLTVLTMAYAIGSISGCHLNPAVSIGLWVARRFPTKDLIPYIVVQVLGATAAAGILYLLVHHGAETNSMLDQTLAANGYGSDFRAAHPSYPHFSMIACFGIEALLTFFFLFIILGSTDAKAPQGFAPLAIGLGLTLIHLVGIPFTNLSVNPARSTGPAIFVCGWALKDLWLFWAAPIVGAIAAGGVYSFIKPKE